MNCAVLVSIYTDWIFIVHSCYATADRDAYKERLWTVLATVTSSEQPKVLLERSSTASQEPMDSVDHHAGIIDDQPKGIEPDNKTVTVPEGAIPANRDTPGLVACDGR
jgi:hypothetical protein